MRAGDARTLTVVDEVRTFTGEYEQAAKDISELRDQGKVEELLQDLQNLERLFAPQVLLLKVRKRRADAGRPRRPRRLGLK